MIRTLKCHRSKRSVNLVMTSSEGYSLSELGTQNVMELSVVAVSLLQASDAEFIAKENDFCSDTSIGTY